MTLCEGHILCVVTLPRVKSLGHHFEASPAFCSVANKLISSETKESRMRTPEFNGRVFVLLLTIKFGGESASGPLQVCRTSINK